MFVRLLIRIFPHPFINTQLTAPLYYKKHEQNKNKDRKKEPEILRVGALGVAAPPRGGARHRSAARTPWPFDGWDGPTPFSEKGRAAVTAAALLDDLQRIP